MDERVVLLLEELVTHPKDQPLDFGQWSGRFQSVLSERLDEGSRVILLDSYKAFLDLFERGLIADGGKVDTFQKARELDWRVLCLQEEKLTNESDSFDPNLLAAIVERELAAGRMQENEWTKLIRAGGEIFGAKPNSETGWFRRIFGG